MSDFKRFPKSKTSCPLKPWLVDFIFSYDSSDDVTANAVKIIENISEDGNGNIMKLVTDGSVHIKANITHQSIKTCMQENDDDMPPWDKALILMRKYSLSFEPKTELENCEFVLIVDEFKLWDLTGFDFKKTLHPCSNIAKVKMKIRENWQKWRESVVPVSDEPSIGDSMGSQLLSLLAEMGQQTQPEDSQSDSQSDQLVIDEDPAFKSDTKSSMGSTDFPPVINGPTLITDDESISESQRQPFLQYIDNKQNNQDISHLKTPESQSQQYEFSSPSEVSLEFSCESSDDSSTENKMAPKSSKNDSKSQNIEEKNMNSSVCIGSDTSIPAGDKPEICKAVVNNVEACDEISATGGEEHFNSENHSKHSESDRRTLAKPKLVFDSRQLNSKDFVKYLKACSTSFNSSKAKQCNSAHSNTGNSMVAEPTTRSIDNDHEKSSVIQTIQNCDMKSLQDSSESQIYINLVENDYDSIQWWSSAEESTCLSDEAGDMTLEKTSEHGIKKESDQNSKHNNTRKHSKTLKQSKRVQQNKEENFNSEWKKKSECTKEPPHKNTSILDEHKILECDKIQINNKTSEPNTSDNFNQLTDVEDNVSGTQPFSVNSCEENLESITDTTCVGLKYKQNLSEMRKHDNENDLSGMQPLVSQPERNSDSVSTREPSDEMLFNSNSNNSCEIIHKSDLSCYEISEFESKNSSDSTKNIVNPVICDDPKSGNSSIIYQSTQKTASKEVPLFHLSPIMKTAQPSASKDKAKESVESLVFDAEYEEELRLRKLAKAVPKTNIKSTSKCGNSSTIHPLNEKGTKNNAIQNKLADKSVFSSDRASNSDLLLIQAAQSAEKRFSPKIHEKHLSSSTCQTHQTSVTVNPSTCEKIIPKPLNFLKTQKENSDTAPETVHSPRENNPVNKSMSNANSSESVIIIGSSESTPTDSDESCYSQNIIKFHTSPRKKHPSQVAEKKTKVKVLAVDTEPNIIDESQDIPTSEMNNSILNHTTMCKTSTSSSPQDDHSVINLSDLSDTSSEEREEPNRQTNHKLKDVFYERLRKRKRKLSMGKKSSVEIGEPSSKRTRCVPEQQVVCVDVHVPKQRNAHFVSKNRIPSNQTVTTSCDKRTSLEKSNNVTPSSKKSCDLSDKLFNLNKSHQSVQTVNCIHELPNINDQSRSSSSGSNIEGDKPSSSNRSNREVDQPRSSRSRSNMEVDQPGSSSSKANMEIVPPRSSSSRSNMEVDQPRSSSSRSNMEVDQPRSSSSNSNIVDDQPRSSSSKANMEIDQPRSSSSCIDKVSEDRNWWEISSQSVNKPSTKDVRNDSRRPESATRNVPQYFEELFEKEPPTELQQKLLNFKIPPNRFDCIHKYIHK